MKEEFLDKGWVCLVDCMGNDYRILQSARVSTGGTAKKGDKEDRGLIRYLYKNQHMSPFEQVVFTFHAKVPNFVMKQILRHRTFSFNEYSQRYSEVSNDYYIPEEWRKQGTTNHQGSGEPLKCGSNAIVEQEYIEAIEESLNNYQNMIDNEIAKEMARIVLPSSIYTEFYFTVNLRNLLHFLELRLHEHTQLETRVFAEAINKILHSLPELKWTIEIFDEITQLNWKIQKILGSKIEPKEIIKKFNLI